MSILTTMYIGINIIYTNILALGWTAIGSWCDPRQQT